MKLSIIIANYNYRDFIGAAIESALAVDWPDKEVIVVDDASTDDSRTVIEGFGDRVTAFFRPKSNQLGTHIFGFEQSIGDVIIFLDADDVLEPEVMLEVAKVWRSGVSKVQYRMNLIDASGAQLGSAIPQFPATENPEELRRTYLRTMTYTTPPGSGNAYSRDCVAKVFEFRPTIPQSDAALLTIAPLVGDVLTIRKPLARYRLHDTSYSAVGSANSATKLRQNLYQDLERERLFTEVMQRLDMPVPHSPLNNSLHHLQSRLASRLLEPAAHPFAEDTTPALVYRLICSAVTYSQMRARDRAVLITWAIACAVAPRSFQRNLVLWRFRPTSRPAVIKALLGVFSSLQSSRPVDRA